MSQSSTHLFMILSYPNSEQTSYQHTKVFSLLTIDRYWWYIQHQQQGIDSICFSNLIFSFFERQTVYLDQTKTTNMSERLIEQYMQIASTR